MQVARCGAKSRDMLTRRAGAIIGGVAAASLSIAGCSKSDAATVSGFTTKLDDVCRTLDLGLVNPGAKTLAAIATSARVAESQFTAAIAAAGALQVPQPIQSDVETFLSNLQDDRALLNQIAVAAAEGNSAVLGEKVARLNSTIAETNQLVVNFGAKRCEMQAMYTAAATAAATDAPAVTRSTGAPPPPFSSRATPATEPTATEPLDTTALDTTPLDTTPFDTTPLDTTAATDPVTTPPDTEPLGTEPIGTEPPGSDVVEDTTPDSTASVAPGGAKRYDDLVPLLHPAGEFTFKRVALTDVQWFLDALGFNEATNVSAGRYTLVDVFDGSGVNFAQVAAFAPDKPMAGGALLQFANTLSQPEGNVTPGTAGGVKGLQFTMDDGIAFVVGDDVKGFYLVFAKNQALLDDAVTAFFGAL